VGIFFSLTNGGSAMVVLGFCHDRHGTGALVRLDLIGRKAAFDTFGSDMFKVTETFSIPATLSA